MEIKTLKDIKYTNCNNSFVYRDDLKQEAIKRWKFFKEKYMKEKDEKLRIHYWGRMEEIREFNDLKSEDLK